MEEECCVVVFSSLKYLKKTKMTFANDNAYLHLMSNRLAFDNLVDRICKNATKKWNRGNECWISNYSTNKYGYCQIRCTLPCVKVHLVHSIMCVYINGLPGDGKQASHRCGNKMCFRHLCWESPNTNTSRNYCQLFRDNPAHICLHKPTCILKNRKTMTNTHIIFPDD